MSPRAQVIIPDGNCLFRSLAVSLVYVFTGKNCGRGALHGSEKTLAHAIHNVVSDWLRLLLVCSLISDKQEITIETEWKGLSLFKVLIKVHKLLQRKKMTSRFESPRSAREFMRRLRPRVGSLRMGKGSKLFPCGLTAAELSQSGRMPSESFSRYCRRLLRRGTWGGASECYVAAQVILLPVYVLQRGQKPQIYLPNDKDDVGHRIVVKYDGEEHYDAVLERGVPILEL